MARAVFVFALVLVAIIGLASAEAPKVPLKAAHSPAGSLAMPPSGSGSDDTIGAIDDAPAPSGSGGDAAVAGTVGGPVAASAYGDDSATATAPAPGSSGASALEVSAVAAAAVAVAGYFF